MAFQLRAIKSDDGMLLKQITIRSVTEDPYAFGGTETLAVELARTDEEWHTLAAECAGEVDAWRDRCIAYFISDQDIVCAKAICFFCGKTARRAYISGAWVDPKYRRQGLGRWLISEACAWASAKGADHLRLTVDDTNPDGVAFYVALGFHPTGNSCPVSQTSTDRESEFEIKLPASISARIA